MAYSPPPFNPGAAAPKKSPVGMIIMIVFVVLFLICGLGAFALWQLGKGALGMASSVITCTMNFELSHKAALAYAKEHGGKLPDADKWQDQIAPYHKRLVDKFMKENKELQNNPVFNFTPGDISQPLACDFGEPKTTITFNKELSGKALAFIKDPATTVLFFEGSNAVKNAADAYKDRPESSSPKIMGSPRDWLNWHVEQKSNPFKSSNSELNMDFNIEDALSGSAPAEPAK